MHAHYLQQLCCVTVCSSSNFLKSCFNFKASRDYVVGQILLSCTEIIKTVEARGDTESFEEPGYMAATLEKVN